MSGTNGMPTENLGDGVIATRTDYAIILLVDKGWPQERTVTLEPEVMERLIKFWETT